MCPDESVGDDPNAQLVDLRKRFEAASKIDADLGDSKSRIATAGRLLSEGRLDEFQIEFRSLSEMIEQAYDARILAIRGLVANAESLEPRFVYLPNAVDPLLMMLIILIAIITFIGLPVTLVDRPEYNLIGQFGAAGAALCLGPLIALVLFAFLARPTEFRIDADGMTLPVPRLFAALGRRSFVKYGEVRNAFVTSVETTGAKFSPFASSAGTVLHIGIGIETVDGRTLTVRFTPSHLMMQTADPALCLEARGAVRARMALLGRKLINDPPKRDEATLASLLDQAQRPLMPFPIIVASFFVVPLLAFLMLFATGLAGLSPDLLRWVLAGGVALLPVALMFRSAFRRNARREGTINELAKRREWEEERKSSNA
ncbi:MAG TPA: hypothetical protein VI893_09505 [Thermoplasmata archaeon]|nr:hypothetical protein [Thermoplasmata archaeon]